MPEIRANISRLLNAEELIVNIEVDDVEKSVAILNSAFKSIQIQEVKGHQLLIATNKKLIPQLTKALVDNEVQLFAIESKRKLEDYFIKMIST